MKKRSARMKAMEQKVDHSTALTEQIVTDLHDKATNIWLTADVINEKMDELIQITGKLRNEIGSVPQYIYEVDRSIKRLFIIQLMTILVEIIILLGVGIIILFGFVNFY